MSTTPTDIPRFINSLVADLQADAWGRGVKLVVDASTAAWTTCPQLQLASCLTKTITSLIQQAPTGTTVSVVTSCADMLPGTETLIIDIAAPGGSKLSLADAAAVAAEAALIGAAYTSCVKPNLATYTFAIPLVPSHQATHIPGLPLVLVVDDDPDMQDYLDVVLRHQGYNVVAVNDGFAALFVIERDRPAVVLTDVMMPNMDGLSLIGRIKRSRRDLPIVVYSGYRDALTDHAETIHLADAFLVKPLPRETLLATLAQAMAPSTH